MNAASDSSARSISGMPPRLATARSSRRKSGNDRHAGRHHQPEPRRPMHIVAEQQRPDQTQQAREQHDRAGNVQPRAGTTRHRRHDPPGRGHDDQAERHVDEEHRAPAQPGEIRRHQNAAEQKAGRTRKAKHHAVNAEGTAARRIGKQQMKGGEHLRHHQRRGRALRQPREDQLGSGLRQPAPQRRDA